MRHLVVGAGLEKQILIESAGTGDWHVGQARDKRSRAVGEARGIPLSGLAQKFVPASFDRYTHVIAMDRNNRDELLKMARSPQDRAKVALLRSFDPTAPKDAEVPDPYYGGARGFEEVFDICERGCRGLLEQLKSEAGV
jgi:protein-tyrosine phosphatase